MLNETRGVFFFNLVLASTNVRVTLSLMMLMVMKTKKRFVVLEAFLECRMRSLPPHRIVEFCLVPDT